MPLHRMYFSEAPNNLTRTDQLTVAESVAKILDYLQLQNSETAISI
jgi:hypothetical protein